MRAISAFSREAGMSTFWCLARIALRIRVRKSATGSVNLICLTLLYCAARSLEPRSENPRRRMIPTQNSGRQTRPRHLPRRLGDAGDLTPERQAAEAQTANAELAQIAARASADAAAIVLPAGKLRFLVQVLLVLCRSRHD